MVKFTKNYKILVLLGLKAVYFFVREACRVAMYLVFIYSIVQLVISLAARQALRDVYIKSGDSHNKLACSIMLHHQVIFYSEHHLIILFLLDLLKSQRVRFLSLSICSVFVSLSFLLHFKILGEFYGQMFLRSKSHSSKFRSRSRSLNGYLLFLVAFTANGASWTLYSANAR